MMNTVASICLLWMLSGHTLATSAQHSRRLRHIIGDALNHNRNVDHSSSASSVSSSSAPTLISAVLRSGRDSTRRFVLNPSHRSSPTFPSRSSGSREPTIDDQVAALMADGCGRQTQVDKDVVIRLQDRSVCPWYWTVTPYDPNRNPPELPEARCRCATAAIGQGIFQCEQVTIPQEVEHFVDGKWQPALEHISVACVASAQRQTKLTRFDGVVEHDRHTAMVMNDVFVK